MGSALLTHPAAAVMSEKQLEDGIRRILSDLPAILAYHPWISVKSKSGWPDWTFCGPRGVIFRELKKQSGKPSKAQQEWLDALIAAGSDAGVWRPSELLNGTIAIELAALAGMGGAG